MNYSKNNLKKRKAQLASKATAAKKKLAALLALAVLVLLVGGIGLAAKKGYGYVQDVLAKAPDISSIDATPSGYMSTVLDADGNVTATLVSSGSNRVYATLDEIPLNLQHAFVAIEDERFYEHNGVDLNGIIRAGVTGLSSGSFSQGASTITQQLLKNNVFDGWTEETREERIERKIQEQYLAIQLEKEVSKDWIMENYLNTINLGQNTLGVQSAANRYFGKSVSDLTLSECAAIAAITQNPSKYNPISHPEENNERRQKVLKNMLDQAYITQEEYDEAAADDIYSRIQTVNTEIENREDSVTSYFVDAVTSDVIRDLQEKLGYSEAEAYKALYSGGLTVYSTQDPSIQTICDEQVNDAANYSTISTQVSFSYALTLQLPDGTVQNYSEQSLLSYYKQNDSFYDLNFPSEEEAQNVVNGYREALLAETGGTVLGENLTFTLQPQVSMTIMDQHTGEVKALVGGRGDKKASLTLNRATDTLRQPGSTFKILTAYATALETDAETLATAVLDEEISYSSGQVIHNAGGGYHGYVSIRYAIQQSLNVVAIKTIWEVTPRAGYEMALNFGISTLTEDDIVESLPLGVGSVSNLEMTAAYAAIANGGTYTEPILYTKVLDHDGNVLLENVPETHRVIQETTAYLLTSAMEDVVSQGTGRLAGFDGMSIAGKTGTAGSTETTTDSWFVGYTPYYTCAIWGGFDDNSSFSSTKFTKYVWKYTMERIHSGLSDPGFAVPEGISQYSVCATSGKLAIRGLCPEVTTEYFKDGTEPTDTCNLHRSVEVCTETGLLANEYCPSTEIRTAVDGEDLPTETCTLHTAESIIDQILEGLEGEETEEAPSEGNEDPGTTEVEPETAP